MLLSKVASDNRDQDQKRSWIKDAVGDAFAVMTFLRYSALSIRAAEVRGPTVSAMPASRRAAKPLLLTLGFGSAVQHTTLFTWAAIKASQQGGVRLPPPR